MPALRFSDDAFLNGNWLKRLDELLEPARGPVERPTNGAEAAARCILGLLPPASGA